MVAVVRRGTQGMSSYLLWLYLGWLYLLGASERKGLDVSDLVEAVLRCLMLPAVDAARVRSLHRPQPDSSPNPHPNSNLHPTVTNPNLHPTITRCAPPPPPPQPQPYP